jgi:hypothetical protein
VLRKISEHMKDEVNEQFKPLYNDTLMILTKSRIFRWARHVTRMRKTRNAYKIWEEASWRTKMDIVG